MIMSYADKVFIEMCSDILENGTDTKDEIVRPKWEDGTPAYTIKKFCVVNRYNLAEEFPALTLRKTAFKSCVDEILWIWQKKSNNINELNSHIWDEWADETGSIGKAYGYQIGQTYIHHIIKNLVNVKIEDLEDLSEYPSAEIVIDNNKDRAYVYLDQIDGVIYDLKHTPYSRRILTSLYVHSDLHEMNLYPCAYSMTFNVTKDASDNKLVLNGILKQRSQDVLAANNWNVVQYSVLLHMIAQVCNMKVGEFVHVIADCHIYDRHVDTIKTLIGREPLPAPTFWINPEIKNFYDFTTDDVKLIDYNTHPQINGIPVAI
jgi:thymidylate synthase